MSEEEIKQIKQTLETWQHIIDFGYGTIEVPNETKIFKTILNLIEKQQKEIEELKELLQGNLYEKYDYYRQLAGSYQANSISKDKLRAEREDILNRVKDPNKRIYKLQVIDKLLEEN